MKINDHNDSSRGRIIFKQKNIRYFKRGIFKVLFNALISIIFGLIGSLIFVNIYFNSYEIDDSENYLKYNYNITGVINKLNQSIVGVSAYIKNEENLIQNNMTGVFYSGDGYIVTNFFGLKNADKIYVKIPTTVNLVREAKIIGFNEEYDLCLLKIDGNDYVKGIFKTNFSDVTHGLNVISMGNSSGSFNSYSVYSGIVTGFDIIENNIKIIKTDININFLNTGGPISDVNGEILGMGSMKFNEDYNSYKEMSSILISSQDVIKLIEEIINSAT